ncbi:MAG: hypothetical protein COT26_00070 [Candidatus Kerfeldbacteria bacterium CG08_land_8_20_14_0_20_43_14]|uniref:Response regulatory domain-containing protein n=1 Tax=Candidatus Kerfeldbacteria bacterium CG08_land_8_20_14_0_20_43_14 TaxID=2014246 RepID=A0A2H0YRD9_9BACT|nr:MAG: hypothetical protein COT26_00070 [Candidatus Kerfeldbacteria bacterium CG08_land_8_20_14_0_20_43_14]
MVKIILLIEDDDTIIRDHQRLNLPDVGIKCLTTAELRRGKIIDIALALQNHGTLAAIIVGGYFPEGEIKNGWEIVRQLKMSGIKAPIIGCSGDQSVAQKFLEAGANEFVERGMSNPTAPLKKLCL